LIGIADPLRKESKAAVRDLRALGIHNIAMLTGDNRGTAAALARELDLEEVHSDLLPRNKLDTLRAMQLRHGAVAMVGDGVNDAPALAAADVGIAMGAAGSDTALETADVVLMSDDLTKVPHSVRLGRHAIRIFRENIIIALATKSLFLILGLLGLSSLWLAILADDGAALAVIVNSLRLLNHR